MNRNQIANEYADYMLSTRCTIIQAADHFEVPKSTLHWRIHHYCTGWFRKWRLQILLDHNYNDRYNRLRRRAARRRLSKAFWDKQADRIAVMESYLNGCKPDTND